MAYTVLSAALFRAKERCQAESSDDAYLTELLEMTAGEDVNGTVHYRPFLVAAKFLEQNPDIRDLSEGDDAKFTLAEPRIQSLLNLQSQYDRANGLTVPAGFEAIVISASVRSKAIGSGSVRTRSVF